MRLTIGDDVKFLHCCPWWLSRQPAIMEASDGYYWSSNGNLPAFFGESRPMPVALKHAIKAFDAGYTDGNREQAERDREQNK